MKSVKEEIEMTQNDSEKITYENLDVPDFVEILEDVLGYNRVLEHSIECHSSDDKHGTFCQWQDKCPFSELCGRGERLGWYDPVERVVYLCINRIKKVSTELGCDVERIVRLHEHTHATLHQKLGDMYFKIPKYIDEPITEFLTFCVLLGFYDEYTDCFRKLSSINPPCYQQWKTFCDIKVYQNTKLEDLLKSNISNYERTFGSVFEAVIQILKGSINLNLVYNWNEFWEKFCEFFKLKFVYEFEIANLREGL
jgi:hypothetical protein